MNTSLLILRDKRKYESSDKLKKIKEKVLTKFEVLSPRCNFWKAWNEKQKGAFPMTAFLLKGEQRMFWG